MPTTLTALPRAVPAERFQPDRRLIFRHAQAAIDRTWSTSLPIDVKVEACWDHIFQAARDLDRLAAHQALHAARIGAAA